MTPDAASRELLAVTAALLDRGRSLHRFATALTLAALGLLAVAFLQGANLVLVSAILGPVLLVGLAEFYLALRVAFDAALFHRLSRQADAGGLDLAAFDAALTALGLLAAGKRARAVEPRAAGARRLLVLQLAAALLQAALVLAAALAAGMGIRGTMGG